MASDAPDAEYTSERETERQTNSSLLEGHRVVEDKINKLKMYITSGSDELFEVK